MSSRVKKERQQAAHFIRENLRVRCVAEGAKCTRHVKCMLAEEAIHLANPRTTREMLLSRTWGGLCNKHKRAHTKLKPQAIDLKFAKAIARNLEIDYE